jgi:hypothetical protein
MTAAARWIGLTVGLSLALVALVQARVPAGTGEVPAFASLKAEPSVKLGVSPVGREILEERTLGPGRSVSGVVRVSNLTGAPVKTEPRLRVVRGEAPDALRLELSAGRKTFYSGTLGDFHATVPLGARAAERVRVRISFPRDAADEIEGRSFDLSLRFAMARAGSRR